jgi:hypothetical protein
MTRRACKRFRVRGSGLKPAVQRRPTPAWSDSGHPETWRLPPMHLFLECCVSAAAVHNILIQSVNRAHVEVLSVATIDDFELRFSLSSDDRFTLLSFSCAVWKAREQCQASHP